VRALRTVVARGIEEECGLVDLAPGRLLGARDGLVQARRDGVVPGWDVALGLRAGGKVRGGAHVMADRAGGERPDAPASPVAAGRRAGQLAHPALDLFDADLGETDVLEPFGNERAIRRLGEDRARLGEGTLVVAVRSLQRDVDGEET